jgi:urea transport system permease protein
MIFTHLLKNGLDRRISITLIIIMAIGILVPLSNLYLPEDNPFHVPSYVFALMGKYLTYALLALALDLVWGFCGILSLGHGAFFALGGYAMGMYLMRQIGDRGFHGVFELARIALVLVWV